MKNNNLAIRRFLVFVFFTSGMTALIYEVLWMRKLSLIFGTSLYGVTTILFVFMAGLGLGSLIFGRLVDRLKRPLWLYGALELGVGVYAMATPFIFRLIEKLELAIFQTPPQDFSSFHLVQFGLAILALIIPTILMGGTLPVAAKFLVRHLGETGNQIARFYFINTLGAVLGTFMAAFVLISLLGVNQTIYLAGLINILIGVGVLSLGLKIKSPGRKGSEPDSSSEPKKQEGGREKVRWLLIAYFLSGVGALSLEVVWTRALTLVLGSTVYAFSLVLAAFLLGIALGSMVMARFVDRVKKPLLAFVIIETLIGILVLATIPMFSKLPFIFLKIYSWTGGSFNQLQVYEFLLAVTMMIGPTFLMGMAFPLVNRLAAGQLKSLGRSVARVYFANTAGSTLGPILAGFLLIPVFGLQKSLVISAAIYWLVAAGMAMLVVGKWRNKALVLLTMMGLVFLGWNVSGWDVIALNSGVYNYASSLIEKNSELKRNDEQVFYKEGLMANVIVRRSKDGILTLVIDGKADAGTSKDMSTQLLLGHLPMLIHPNPEDVLVIGLGSGVTLGAVEQHPELKTVEAVEIEPAVVEAAEYFSEANNNALQDPRLKLIIGDGRNYALMTDKQYDVITAEPSNPWMAGNANLFTKEQFELYRNRLKPGGVMLQWAHVYQLSLNDVKTIIASFQTVFPHTVVWQGINRGDIFLIGSEESLKIDAVDWQKKINQEKVKKDLSRINLDDPWLFLSYLTLNEEGVEEFSKGGKIHSDNYPVLEFQSPKTALFDREARSLEEIASFKAIEQQRADMVTILKKIKDKSLEEKIANYTKAWEIMMQAETDLSQNDFEKVVEKYRQAVALTPDNIRAKKGLARALFLSGKGRQNLLEAIEWDGENYIYYKALAATYVQENDKEEAIEIYRQAVEKIPENVEAWFELGSLYGEVRDFEKAEQAFNKVLELDPKFYQAYNDLAIIYISRGERQKAVEALEMSLEIEPDQPEMRERLKEFRLGE